LPAQENRFVMNSVARARELEAAGQPPEALRQYKIALTVRPNQGAAKEGRERLEKALQKDAEEHYRAGLRMQKEGRHAQALQQFLTHVFPIWEVLQMVIREYWLSDKGKVHISADSDQRYVCKLLPQWMIYHESSAGGSKGTGRCTANTLRAVSSGRYRRLLRVQQVLSVKNDSVAKEYSYKSSFELALEFFQKKEYLAAKEQFLVSLKHNSNCQQCHFYIRRSEELYKEMHYKQGIEHYGKEQLTHAIMEWELVSALDPKYKRVDYYIKKAKDLQSKIDELKKQGRKPRIRALGQAIGLVDENLPVPQKPRTTLANIQRYSLGQSNQRLLE
jgi:tetratricopeptide (TPR) repeat protein